MNANWNVKQNGMSYMDFVNTMKIRLCILLIPYEETDLPPLPLNYISARLIEFNVPMFNVQRQYIFGVKYISREFHSSIAKARFNY